MHLYSWSRNSILLSPYRLVRQIRSLNSHVPRSTWPMIVFLPIFCGMDKSYKSSGNDFLGYSTLDKNLVEYLYHQPSQIIYWGYKYPRRIIPL